MLASVTPSEEQLRACCAADVWVVRMRAAAPFDSHKAALDLSDDVVLGLDDHALDQALDAHARIGERRLGSTTEDRWSRTEQAGALTADDAIQVRIAEGNAAYEARFGRVFLIRAAGRSADDILAALDDRLDNDPETEGQVVRRELAEIVRLRLVKVLDERSAQTDVETAS